MVHRLWQVHGCRHLTEDLTEVVVCRLVGGVSKTRTRDIGNGLPVNGEDGGGAVHPAHVEHQRDGNYWVSAWPCGEHATHPWGVSRVKVHAAESIVQVYFVQQDRAMFGVCKENVQHDAL